MTYCISKPTHNNLSHCLKQHLTGQACYILQGSKHLRFPVPGFNSYSRFILSGECDRVLSPLFNSTYKPLALTSRSALSNSQMLITQIYCVPIPLNKTVSLTQTCLVKKTERLQKQLGAFWKLEILSGCFECHPLDLMPKQIVTMPLPLYNIFEQINI